MRFNGEIPDGGGADYSGFDPEELREIGDNLAKIVEVREIDDRTNKIIQEDLVDKLAKVEVYGSPDSIQVAIDAWDSMTPDQLRAAADNPEIDLTEYGRQDLRRKADELERRINGNFDL